MVLGFSGVTLFHTYDKLVAKQHTVPPRMFGSWTSAVGIPYSIIACQILSRLGEYRALHFAGFALGTLASGLGIDLDANSSLAKIVIFRIIAA